MCLIVSRGIRGSKTLENLKGDMVGMLKALQQLKDLVEQT